MSDTAVAKVRKQDSTKSARTYQSCVREEVGNNVRRISHLVRSSIVVLHEIDSRSSRVTAIIDEHLLADSRVASEVESTHSKEKPDKPKNDPCLPTGKGRLGDQAANAGERYDSMDA
jgi:hypothetical protein